MRQLRNFIVEIFQILIESACVTAITLQAELLAVQLDDTRECPLALAALGLHVARESPERLQ